MSDFDTEHGILYDNWTELEWWGTPEEDDTRECHACYGTGMDEYEDTDCMICWGDGVL